MRTIIKTGPGEVQLNWMWLPTFIGSSTVIKTEIEKLIGPRLVGQPLDDATLDMANEEIIDFLQKKFSYIVGLREYLDALKFVGEN